MCSSLISWVAENRWAFQRCCHRRTHQWESCFVPLQKRLAWDLPYGGQKHIYCGCEWAPSAWSIWRLLCWVRDNCFILHLSFLVILDPPFPLWSSWPSIIVSVLLRGHTPCSGLRDSARDGTESLKHFLSPKASWRLHSSSFSSLSFTFSSGNAWCNVPKCEGLLYGG